MHLIPIEFIWDEQTLKRRLNLKQVFEKERERWREKMHHFNTLLWRAEAA